MLLNRLLTDFLEDVSAFLVAPFTKFASSTRSIRNLFRNLNIYNVDSRCHYGSYHDILCGVIITISGLNYNSK